MSSTNDIQSKWQSLEDDGVVDLGSALGVEQDAPSGGQMQIYERGRIYWHASTGARGVHGNILDEYLRLGGPGKNPITGSRSFGYPTSDRKRLRDDVYANEFEWGVIHWVSGVGSLSLYGEFFKQWRTAELEYPLVEPEALAGGGQVAFFRDGCIMDAGGGLGHIVCTLRSDAAGWLGKPQVVKPTEAALNCVRLRLDKSVWERIQRERAQLLSEAWDGRLALQSVASPAERVPLSVEVASVTPVPTTAAGEPASPPRVLVQLKFRPAPGVTLKNRHLYSLALRTAGNHTYVLAPHAIYTRRSWTDFGLLHITDLHVSRRADVYHRRLLELGRVESAKLYNNYNNALRDTIRYANHLHDLGLIDFILATGDLVDYQFEKGDNRSLGGNFLYLEKVLRGKVERPDGGAVEALHVPIFMTLGNHDYRPNPYGLIVDIDVSGWPDPDTIENFAPHNLSRADALALLDERTKVSEETALGMAKVEAPDYYFKSLAPAWKGEASYVLQLGPHRFVMLDSKHDLGVFSGKWDAVKESLGFGSDAQKNFAGGAPNQVGFEDYHLPLVANALAEAGEHGVVVIGVHAPPLNIKGGEFPSYFRETEHKTADEKDVIDYLKRQSPMFVAPLLGEEGAADLARALHPGWMNTIGQPYFMKGALDDLLDHDTSHGRANEFLQLCAGINVDNLVVARPVDVVLCGHGHNRVEFRLKWDRATKQMRYFTDFYTENPSEYYGTRKAVVDAGKRRVAVEVKAGAAANSEPVKAPADRKWDGDEWKLQIPPYARPLASASDLDAWWASHAPLCVQTGGIGPCEGRSNDRIEPSKQKPDVSFQGFRVISISGRRSAACDTLLFQSCVPTSFACLGSRVVTLPSMVPTR